MLGRGGGGGWSGGPLLPIKHPYKTQHLTKFSGDRGEGGGGFRTPGPPSESAHGALHIEIYIPTLKMLNRKNLPSLGKKINNLTLTSLELWGSANLKKINFAEDC